MLRPQLRPGPFARNPHDGRRYVREWFMWRLAELLSPRSVGGRTVRETEG